MEELPEEETEKTDEDISSQQSRNTTLRPLTHQKFSSCSLAREVCLAREGSSEPALSQQLHSETLTCARQRERGKGRQAWGCWRERCARSSLRNTGQCPALTLLPGATQGTPPPRPLVASCYAQILPWAWPNISLPSALYAGRCRLANSLCLRFLICRLAQ